LSNWKTQEYKITAICDFFCISVLMSACSWHIKPFTDLWASPLAVPLSLCSLHWSVPECSPMAETKSKLQCNKSTVWHPGNRPCRRPDVCGKPSILPLCFWHAG